MPPPSSIDPQGPGSSANTGGLRVGGPDYFAELEALALGLDDELATQESNALADEDDLEKVERKNDHHRMESLRAVVNDLAKWFLILTACLVTVGILFWSWHLLMPEELWFLAEKQLDTVQTILTTIIFSGLVGGYARRVIEGRANANNSNQS